MDEATRALLGLWDVAGENVRRARGADDWARPLPTPAPGLRRRRARDPPHRRALRRARPAARGPSRAARHRAETQLADRTAGDPVLGAHCLDMCLHVHDLTAPSAPRPTCATTSRPPARRAGSSCVCCRACSSPRWGPRRDAARGGAPRRRPRRARHPRRPSSRRRPGRRGRRGRRRDRSGRAPAVARGPPRRRVVARRGRAELVGVRPPRRSCTAPGWSRRSRLTCRPPANAG